MPTLLTVYDGASTVGGNKILLEDGGVALFLDFGTPFATRARYFEEFLAPRSRAGLLDLIQMGLLPPLRGIYRGDLEDPQGRVWERAERHPAYREVDADAVLLTHAHMDHAGYISFLDPVIPVICSAMSAYLCKAIQDCGAHQFEGEMCYITPKIADEEGTLGAARPKDFPYVRRPYHLSDAIPPDPLAFWNLTPAAPRGRYFPPQSLTVTDTVRKVSVRFFPVDHSIYGAAATAIETSSGWVVYTGDLRRHGTRRILTEGFIREANRLGPVALLSEGTNVGREPGTSEEQVYEASLRAVREAAGELVVADFGPRNVERLLTFLEVARRTGRRLAITDKDAYLLTAMHAVDAGIPTPGTDRHMVVYHRALRHPQHWVEHVRTWYPDQASARDVAAHAGDYILCFSFFDIAELVDINPSGGIWIYSSSEAHNEEQQFELWRLRNWIDYFHLRPLGLSDGPSPFHASGHLSGRELRALVYEIAPRQVIPVHTTDPRRFADMLGGDIDVRLPEIGVPIVL